MESPEPFRGQAVNETVGSGMEHVGGRRLRQGETKRGAEEYYYRSLLRGDEVLECLLLKKLKLTAQKMLRWKAVSQRGRVSDAAQRERSSELGGRVEFSEGLAAVPRTAPRG